MNKAQPYDPSLVAKKPQETFEPAVVELVDQLPALTITQYAPFKAEAEQLVTEYGHIPDASTDDGYKNIEAGLKACKTFRLALEKERKRIKEPAKLRVDAIDGEARIIREKPEAIEAQLKRAKLEWDNREAIAAKARQDEQRATLTALIDDVLTQATNIKMVDAGATALNAINLEHYPDIFAEGVQMKRDAVDALAAIKTRIEEAEKQRRIAAENAAESERLAKQRAEQDRRDAELRQKQQAEADEKRIKEAAALAERQKARAELDAKNRAEAVVKMRERLTTVDWSKPSDGQIEQVWSILRAGIKQ